MAKRKRLTTRQKIALFDLHGGLCWRCGGKIWPSDEWEVGHCDKAHWIGGTEVAPEHKSCNREDGKEQTKLEAKSVRVRARQLGIKKRIKYNWQRGRYEWRDD